MNQKYIDLGTFGAKPEQATDWNNDDAGAVDTFMKRRATVSVPSMWTETPQPEATLTTTHREGDPLFIVKAQEIG